MHRDFLESEYPGLYEQLILNGTLYKHLADEDERAVGMLERLIEQMAAGGHHGEPERSTAP